MLNKYVYSEVEELSEKTGLDTNTALEVFLRKHMERAWKQKNHHYYTHTLDKLIQVYHYQKRYKEDIDVTVKSFLINLNPYMMNPELIEVYDPEKALLETVKTLRFFEHSTRFKVNPRIEITGKNSK